VQTKLKDTQKVKRHRESAEGLARRREGGKLETHTDQHTRINTHTHTHTHGCTRMYSPPTDVFTHGCIQTSPTLPPSPACASRMQKRNEKTHKPTTQGPPPPAPLSTTYLCALTKQTSNEKRENKIVVTAGCVVLLRLTRGEINHRYGGRAIDMVHKSLSLEETKHGEHAQSDQREAGGDRAG
jgi:hypothetical protein